MVSLFFCYFNIIVFPTDANFQSSGLYNHVFSAIWKEWQSFPRGFALLIALLFVPKHNYVWMSVVDSWKFRQMPVIEPSKGEVNNLKPTITIRLFWRKRRRIFGASISMLNVLKSSLMQLDIIFLKDFNSQFSTKWSYLESCYIYLEQLFNRICFAFFSMQNWNTEHEWCKHRLTLAISGATLIRYLCVSLFQQVAGIKEVGRVFYAGYRSRSLY